jgi:AAA domain
MAHVIAFLNPKGGTGKTTLSINLARALQQSGYRVLIVDSDPQGMARDWSQASQSGTPSGLVIRLITGKFTVTKTVVHFTGASRAIRSRVALSSASKPRGTGGYHLMVSMPVAAKLCRNCARSVSSTY